MRRLSGADCPVGRIAFTVRGMGAEKLLDRAAGAGIAFENLSCREDCIRGEVGCRDVRALSEKVQEGGWRLTLHGARGAAVWVREAFRRRFLLLMAVALLLAAVLSTRFVWQVNVLDAGVYAADARVYLEQCGVSPGTWRKSVDLSDLRSLLEWRYPDVAWIECGWRGMTLQVRFHQGTPAGEVDTTAGSGDVLAARSGIVTRVITLCGTPMVSPGDIVRQGQVLIKGEERSSAGENVPVVARGKVFARVWEQAEVMTPTTEITTIYTGQQQETYTVTTPLFDLWKTQECTFEQSDIHVTEKPLGGLFFPFTIRWETRLEADFEHRTLPRETLEAQSGLAALQKLQFKCQNGDDFLTKWVDYSMIDAEILLAVATGERIIDIAVPVQP